MNWIRGIGLILIAPFVFIFLIIILILAEVYRLGGGDINRHWLGKFVRYE